MNNTLESSKIFPYVAWTLVVFFAVFTYFLTVRLSEELARINESVARVEEKLNTISTQATSTKVQ